MADHPGRFRRLSLDHKLQFAAIVVGAAGTIATGIVVPFALSGSHGSNTNSPGSDAANTTINNTINKNTVNNYYTQPSVGACTPALNRPGHSDLMLVDLKIATISKDGCWTNGNSVDDTPVTVAYEIVYKNMSKDVQRDVAVRVQLPSNMIVVPHTTRLYNSLSSQGQPLRDDSVASNGGQDIGSYAPNANAFVSFTAVTPDKSLLKCGKNILTAILGIRTPTLPETTQAVSLITTRQCPA